MRLLESLIAGIIFFSLAVSLFPILRKKMGFSYLPLGAGLLIPVHLLVEGYRWQMVPLFVFTLGFILFSLYQHYRRSGKSFVIRLKTARIITRIFVVILFALSVVFPKLLPIVHLPEPGGPFAVGTISYRMTDFEREELFTADSLDYRSLLVTAWYPAEVEEEMTPGNYWDKEGHTGKIYSMNSGMGSFWYSHLRLMKTNSYLDSPLLSGKPPFPVIIYTPAFYGMNTENTMLLEELASHGYIVFSITHSYETIVSVFPDGEVVPGNLEHISGLFDSNADQEDQLYEEYKNTESMEQKIELTKQILVVDELFNQLVKTRREDIVFVLDEITKFNQREGIFKAGLDLEHIGIFGWSFGGAATLEACIADSRLKAGINIDGWPYGELTNSSDSIAQPIMIIRSESEDEMEDIVSNLVLEKVKNSASMLLIKGAEHINFWDFPLFFKIYAKLGYWGPIDPLRLLEIESAYIKGFFDMHLRGEHMYMQEGASDLFPEVSFEVK